jgi:hypothetical protein
MTRALLTASLSGFALLVVTAFPARASSLAELSAASGVQNSLTGMAAPSASHTLDSVRRSLSKSSSSSSGHGGSSWLTNDGGSSSHGGRGGGHGSSRGGNGNGWATAHSGGIGGGGWLQGGEKRTPSPRRR